MKPEKLTRALLGDHQDRILWRPAFLRFLDTISELGCMGSWTQELQDTPPEGFIARFRGQAQHAYTAASKGIHHEYLLPIQAYSDKPSLDVLIETGIKTAAGLSVVANFCDHISFVIPPKEAVTMYEALQ